MEITPDKDPAKSPPSRGGFRRGRIFFQKLFSSPSLLWKAIMSLVFISIGIGILVSYGFKDSLMAAFAGLLFLYGVSRFIAFYTEYKRDEDE